MNYRYLKIFCFGTVVFLRLLIISLLAFITIAASGQSGTKVTSSLVPNSNLDNYPTHQAKYGKGGYRSVATLTERDAILSSRRDTGMLVYVIAADKIYTLKTGISNANWEEFKVGSEASTDTVVYTRNGQSITTAGYTYTFRTGGTNTNYSAFINTYDAGGNPVDSRFTKANNSITIYPTANCTLDALIVLNSFAPGGGGGGSIAETDPVYNAEKSQYLTAETDPVYNLEKSQYITAETDPVVKAVNGLIKSDGSTISAASAGVDYVQPAALSSYIPKSDTVNLLTPWNSNFKKAVKYNDSTVIYIPSDVAIKNNLFLGSSGGKYLTHTTSVTGQSNLVVGPLSGTSLTTGYWNFLLGERNGRGITTGFENIAIGANVLNNSSAVTGNRNTIIGSGSGQVITTGSYNIGIGSLSHQTLSTGSKNISIGYRPLRNNSIGNINISIGDSSGYNNTGNLNLYIGNKAGYSNTTDNKLYIENSNSQTPLIGGKFDLDQLGVNMTITKPWNFTHNVGGSIGAGYVNTVSIDTIKGLTMAGSATVWEDIDFPIIIRTTGTNIPTISTTQGNLTSPQWAVNDFAVCEKKEIPHAAKIGATTYQWHIHLETGGTNVDNRYVSFEIEWNWANNGAAFSVPATISSGDLLIPANTPSNTHLVFNIGSPFGLTGQTLGAHIKPRLKRVTSTGTAPTANPFCEMLQIHYERDSEGSSTINTK